MSSIIYQTIKREPCVYTRRKNAFQQLTPIAFRRHLLMEAETYFPSPPCSLTIKHTYMQTNFFSLINTLQIEGDITLNIKCGKHQHLLISVLFKNENITDKASKNIPPMNLKGTVQEMDDGFFKTIGTPLQKTAALFTNMEAYEKAVEEARVNSKMEQDKTDKHKKEKESGNKKFEAAMKKVTELEQAEKYREAYAQMPKIEDFPDHEQEIKDKKEALAAHFDQPSLF